MKWTIFTSSYGLEHFKPKRHLIYKLILVCAEIKFQKPITFVININKKLRYESGTHDHRL